MRKEGKGGWKIEDGGESSTVTGNSYLSTCECLETQWRSTFRTRMVAAVLMTLSLRLLRSLQLPARCPASLPRGLVTGDKSLGLLLADVAIAKAAAAVDVLLLQIIY